MTVSLSGSLSARLPAQGRRIRAIAAKELAIFASYRASMVLRMFEIWYFAISFYFIDRFVGDVALLEQTGGGYFEFVLIGSIVTSFSFVGLSAFSALINEEQSEGTLEIALTTPTPIWTMVAGSFAVPVIFLIVETVVLVGVGLGLFGSGIPVVGLVKSLPVLLLTTLSFLPIGILAAAFIVLAKQGDPFAAIGHRVSMLLSGALYPISVLPDWLQRLSRLVPSFYGVRAVRTLTQGSGSFADVLPDVAVLVVFSAVMLPLSIRVFRWSIGLARRAGTLGAY